MKVTQRANDDPLMDQSRSQARRRPGREARPVEDRQRDRTEDAKAACERRGHLEGGEVARDRDWHGPSHLKGAWLKASTAILSLSPTSTCAPPVGGTFWFQTFIQAPSPEIWSETISGGEDVLAGKWGGLFFGYLLGKNFWRRDRDHLIRPG